MAPIVVTRGLHFAYGDIVALSGVDLEVPEGRIGLVGANGAGKTTLLRILLGILPAAQGRVEVLGNPVPERTLAVRSLVGYMPEGQCLPPDQTASDFLIYAAELGGLPLRAARQRASDVLTIVGLHEERFRPMGGFSTGMQQRAKLAQAIVHDPRLVMLDEPTAGLDPEGREEMLDLITRLDDFGINAIVSSHVLPDIERTCSWVVMLDGGKVLRSGPLTELSSAENVRLEVLDDHDRVAAALAAAGAEVTADGAGLLVALEGGDPFALVRDVLADTGAGIRRMGPRRTTLEDVYLAEGEGAGHA
ncbi:MAG: ABC transporter ATP-binding protein [Actinobacteria bacterium]|nr:ABC transporter ATP-binding protein [Actinomycetota bacterium]